VLMLLAHGLHPLAAAVNVPRPDDAVAASARSPVRSPGYARSRPLSAIKLRRQNRRYGPARGMDPDPTRADVPRRRRR
jgi:hypothetical protein